MGYTNTKRQILKISYITVIVNVFLVTAKILGGIYGHSQALFSEAIHSFADLISTLLVILSVYLMHLSTSEKEKRRNNIIQGIFSLILTVVLFATCANLVYENVSHLVHKEYLHAKEPKIFELVIAGASVVSKEIIYHWTCSNAKKLHYPPLEANAWHQRLEAMISFGTLISILFVKLFDFKIADNVIAIIIALFLLFIIYEDLVTAFEKISGKHFGHKHSKLKHVNQHHDNKHVHNVTYNENLDSIESEDDLVEDFDPFTSDDEPITNI